MKLTLKQAYMSMFYYLCRIWNKVKDDKTIYNIDDFSAFMGGINPFLFKGSMSADPAAWEDWISCVNKIKSNNSEEIILTSVETFDCMISFIKFYIDDMNFNFNWLIKFIYREKNVCKKDNIIDEWDECILKVLQSDKNKF